MSNTTRTLNLEAYLHKWNLVALRKIAETRTSDVYLVEYAGRPAVLKVLTETGKRDESHGAFALQCFDSSGAIRLLNFDDGAHLLSYADGHSLKDLVKNGQDAVAAETICEVVRKLHKHPGTSAPKLKTLDENFRSLFLRSASADEDPIFRRASKLASELLRAQNEIVVLHGDLHHTNILHSSEQGWVAIDPKGLIGERAYDLANFFFNPDDVPNVVEQTARIEMLANTFSNELGIEFRIILLYAFTYGCLSASWAIEDGLNPARRLRIAKIIESKL